MDSSIARQRLSEPRPQYTRDHVPPIGRRVRCKVRRVRSGGVRFVSANGQTVARGRVTKGKFTLVRGRLAKGRYTAISTTGRTKVTIAA